MSRASRVEIAGGLYHFTSRGNRGEDIFLDDTDRELWLTTLEGPMGSGLASCLETFDPDPFDGRFNLLIPGQPHTTERNWFPIFNVVHKPTGSGLASCLGKPTVRSFNTASQFKIR